MPKAPIEGTLVAVVGREFKPFTNSDGEKINGGITFRAWISGGFDTAPFSIKVKADAAQALQAAGPGATVKGECWMRAKGDRIEQELDTDSLSVFTV